MQRYGHDDPYEREPLDSSHNQYGSPPRRPVPPSHTYSQPDSPFHDASPRYQPQDSPSSPFNRARGRDVDDYDYSGSNSPYAHPAAAYGSPVPPRHADMSFSRGESTRTSPPAADAGPSGDRNTRYAHAAPSNTITPGADNFSNAASGGMAGIAYSVAERNARESGVEAMRGAGQVPPPPSRAQYPNQPRQPLAPQGGGGYRYDHSSYGKRYHPSP